MRKNLRHRFWGAKNTRFTGWRRIEALNAKTDPSELSADEELRFLRCYVEGISQRVNIIKKIIEDKKVIDSQSPKVVAIVDEGKCSGCGICYEVCPVGAISVNRIARIDENKCTACLACVKECSQGAIAIRY
ncbi:MAG: 4Fe-4S binding protein [Candidatus Edwardsbacteria bacterium]